MTLKRLAMGIGILLIVACGHPNKTHLGTALGTFHLVEAIVDYRPHDVPAAFQHLVDWHAGTASVVLLYGVGGRRACAITPVQAAYVIVGKPFRCHWSAAR